jgi:hypothetical protein
MLVSTKELKLSNRSRRFIILLLLVGPAAASREPQLNFTFDGYRIDYCDTYPDLAMAYIHITAEVENRSEKNLILSRHLGPHLDLTVKDLSGRVVYRPEIHIYETKVTHLGPKPDDNLFEIVKPRQSAKRDFIIDLPISKDPAHRVDSTPPPGIYLIDAARSTWPFYADSRVPVQKRMQWKQFGTLVTSDIRMKNFKVELTLPAGLHYCDKQAERGDYEAHILTQPEDGSPNPPSLD